jgi:hypothetical protein
MRSNNYKSARIRSGIAASVLLLASGAVLGQQVNLTAKRTTTLLPDGSSVPMWGLFCNDAGTGASCAVLKTPTGLTGWAASAAYALNAVIIDSNGNVEQATTAGTSGTSVPAWSTTAGGTTADGAVVWTNLVHSYSATWAPPVITVPAGTGTFTINLTNSLPVAPPASAGGTPVGIPTSLVIVGQLGGGLGNTATTTTSPNHTNAQPVTWPIAGNSPGAGLTGVGTPPTQGPRVQSFSTEVVNGSNATLTFNNLRPGTYLIESGTHPSIQGPMGLYGIVVVTTVPAGTTAGTAYPAAGATAAVTYNAEVPLLFSEIDPVQNAAVATAVTLPGFSETTVWSGLPGGCGNPATANVGNCYPPAVNYTPLYYLINGVAFDTTHSGKSLFPVSPATGVAGTVLVRMVNAGLRMHVPSIVGSLTAPTPTSPVVNGLSLMAEDGNPLPGIPRVQNEVFMAAGKTYDVMINVPASGSALPVYDRQLSLSGNGIERDAGMLAYISVNAAAQPTTTSTAIARADTYNSLLGVVGQHLTVSDPSKGLIGNDSNVYGVAVSTPSACSVGAPCTLANGTLTLNADGTFTYVTTGNATSDAFQYCANGSTTICATVTLGGATKELASGITLGDDVYASTSGPKTTTPTAPARLVVSPPGVLLNDKDGSGFPLSVDTTTITGSGGNPLPACSPPAVATNCVTVNADGSFVATAAAAGTYTFTYRAKNTQGTTSATSATVSVTFPTSTGLAVTVFDGQDKKSRITDYRWIIEEDRTFYVDPKCTTNTPAAGCPTAGTIVPTFGTNFHTSYMPVVATGCTGTLSCESGQTINNVPVVCDVGDGICRNSASQQAPLDPSQVSLDPRKRYYISILPGDAANPFIDVNLTANCSNDVATANQVNPTTGAPLRCGHGMGGAPLTFGQTSVTLYTQPAPYPTAKLSVFVFEDDAPLNGEQDGGGGIGVLSPNEPGLGSFNITLFDDAGGSGDPTGQMTYDMFNQPLANSLAGTIDPVTQKDACPISKISRIGVGDPTQTGITGTIVTCPKYESDGATLSPLAGQAVVANLMPGRYGVVATPGADRIGRGEEWLQTNTLDGQKAHDSFLRIGEPSFFQEFGPAGYHVSIGFANPAIINSRKAAVCNGTDPNVSGANCTNTLTGLVTTLRMSRTPDERLYSSGSNNSFAFTQCYVSFGDTDGEDFAFTKCNPDGTFTLPGLPDGDWRVTVFDQWNDMLVDGLSTPVRLSGGSTVNLGEIATNQWQANIYTRTFFDQNGNGVADKDANGNDLEQGLTLVPTNIRFRDGSFSNFNNTDLNGYAGFNEVFPLFSWYVIETDSTRYKNTGTHVVYDAGGPADGSSSCKPGTTAPCGGSKIGNLMANTVEQASVPTSLRVPGAVYCKTADCTGHSIAAGPGTSDPPTSGCALNSAGQNVCSTQLSTGRIDPPWVTSEGWQGFSGQNSFVEFGKAPFAQGENGGIRGHVVYASTRPFDDPQLLLQTKWEPLVPGVTINLYQEGTAADGVAQTLTLIDSTRTSSWDDWAQGFRSDGNPNMNCPGQLAAPTSTAGGDLFFFTLFNQPMYLDVYNNGGTPAHTIPNNSQFKCYDGMHNWNQVQPAPYDGMYQFPSIAGRNPQTGAPTGGTGGVAGTNCTICVPNPTDGTPMLPAGKYVVEVVVPPGYELVKEEDKNILIGDNFIAPVTQEFPGLGSAIYILPDQAAIGAAYNYNNAQNQTVRLGTQAVGGDDATHTEEQTWPCVGAARIVPDYMSIFPNSHEVAPFAGATRNLCDRKEVILDDQTSALAKFYVFTSAHAAAHFTGVITDDFTSEFDPFSPQFGEKFSPANLPVAIKDWSGIEISRVYTDQWGSYNGLTYSTWEVNPPNPTGYSPTMMVTCMNDPGTGSTPDPLYNPAYSQFCYEIPFMPAQTQYMDTPVVPTSAFASAGYNNPDCDYPDATPAVSEVDGDGVGPWVNTGGGHTLKIYALGNESVGNYAYSGPSSTTAPFNQKTLNRRYGFGSTRGTVALVGADGVAHNLTGVSWSDTYIIGTVPTVTGPGMNCPIQQQIQYSHLAASAVAQCGELVITTAPSTAHPKGQQSVDTVTVTIGGKAPTHVAATASLQSALDAAAPGDLIMVDPAARATTSTPAVPAIHQELLLMWKPVRLQGVGAASSVLNANSHPAGRIEVWRRQVDCLFGLALNGMPPSGTNPFDPTGTYSCPGAGWTNWAANPSNPQVDRLPLEPVVGWNATQNGNMAELLQEPSLMGALEGAGITVLSKGVQFPPGSDPFGVVPSAAEEAGPFPPGTILLTGSTSSTHGCGPNSRSAKNPFPSNFLCNPSSIDGITVTNSSQGGGGIFVHGWGHDIQIANNRVTNNSGTLSGGISIGQGEFSPSITVGGTLETPPGSCQSELGLLPNTQLQYCYDRNVNIHHNAVTRNSSTGDELFSATPAGAGGVTICNGSDFYKFNYNWVCGNLSTGDGGGVAHVGFSYNGDIEHNSILFNQSTNPTIPTNGGGLLVMGAPDVDPTCSGATDKDCLNPTPIAPADGIGPGLVINANLIRGNGAESGSGGGIALQHVNGTDVLTFPTMPSRWFEVDITNNIIDNNVAGWDGAGISLLDALSVNIVNNTIASNDTTASSGVLFNTVGAPLASTQGPCPNGGTNSQGICTTPVTTSTPQPAGIVAIQNSSRLTANLPASVNCPAGHGSGGTGTDGLTNGACRNFSYPELFNNVLWQNRSFYIAINGAGSGTTNQQNTVGLFNGFTATPAASQPAADATTANGTGSIITGGTGACVDPGTAPNYWDIGVRGDTGPANHDGSTFTRGTTTVVTPLAPTYSVLTSLGSATDYGAAGLHNTASNPTFLSQYCDGSRIPPENGGMGYQVPPGIADATVPNPVFSLTPAATVDEGNNWINISWGPLSLVNTSNGPLNGATLGDYGPSSTSSVINYIPISSPTYAAAPGLDFYGTQRKTNNLVDAGAVEFTGPVAPVLSVSVTPGSLSFGNWASGTTSSSQEVTVTNTGNTALADGLFTFGGGTPQPFTRPAGSAGGTCGATLAIGTSCTINVVFSPLTATAFTRSLTVAYAGATVTGSPVTLTGAGVPNRAALSVTPNTLTITLPTGATTGTGVVTLTNTAAAGGAQVAVTRVNVPVGGNLTSWFFNIGTLAGPNTCTATTLAPGATCTVTVKFTNVNAFNSARRGVNRNDTITFTDNGVGNTQTGKLIGFATP